MVLKYVTSFYPRLVFVRIQAELWKRENIAHFICIVKGIKRGFPLLQREFSLVVKVTAQNIETLGEKTPDVSEMRF